MCKILKFHSVSSNWIMKYEFKMAHTNDVLYPKLFVIIRAWTRWWSVLQWDFISAKVYWISNEISLCFLASDDHWQVTALTSFGGFKFEICRNRERDWFNLTSNWGVYIEGRGLGGVGRWYIKRGEEKERQREGGRERRGYFEHSEWWTLTRYGCVGYRWPGELDERKMKVDYRANKETFSGDEVWFMQGYTVWFAEVCVMGNSNIQRTVTLFQIAHHDVIVHPLSSLDKCSPINIWISYVKISCFPWRSNLAHQARQSRWFGRLGSILSIVVCCLPIWLAQHILEPAKKKGGGQGNRGRQREKIIEGLL